MSRWEVPRVSCESCFKYSKESELFRGKNSYASTRETLLRLRDESRVRVITYLQNSGRGSSIGGESDSRTSYKALEICMSCACGSPSVKDFLETTDVEELDTKIESFPHLNFK